MCHSGPVQPEQSGTGARGGDLDDRRGRVPSDIVVRPVNATAERHADFEADDIGVDNLFVITDGTNEVEVQYTGVLPDLFAEGRGVIVRGKLKDNVFIASQVLAKHDEKYMPREIKNNMTN